MLDVLETVFAAKSSKSEKNKKMNQILTTRNKIKPTKTKSIKLIQESKNLKKIF
jgi:hypothetical protein